MLTPGQRRLLIVGLWTAILANVLMIGMDADVPMYAANASAVAMCAMALVVIRLRR